MFSYYYLLCPFIFPGSKELNILLILEAMTLVRTIAKGIVKLIIETRQFFCLYSCRLYFDVYILNAIVLSSKGFDRDGLGIDVKFQLLF